jgi:hypothetical protein
MVQQSCSNSNAPYYFSFIISTWSLTMYLNKQRLLKFVVYTLNQNDMLACKIVNGIVNGGAFVISYYL